MTGVLLDTHAWIWSLTDDPRLSTSGRRAIDAAEAVYVSPISFFEVGQKVRIGNWPEMADHVTALPDLLRQARQRTAMPARCAWGFSPSGPISR